MTEGGVSTGRIYVIQADGGGPLKVGWTMSPQLRLVGLQTGSPLPLRLLTHRPGSRTLEGDIHAALRPWHSHGEWFYPAQEVVAELAQRQFPNTRLIATWKKVPARPAHAIVAGHREFLSRAKSKHTACSFCGQEAEEVFRLIRGPDDRAICDLCVELASQVIAEARAKVPA